MNRLGENILEKYGIAVKPVTVRCRDLLSIAMYREALLGNDAQGSMPLDTRAMTEEQWNRDEIVRSMRKYLESSYECRKRPLRTFPTCHFWMGGVVIDPDGATEMPGLYAAREVTGGLHGANRMGGNALTEAVVFGTLAGASAAEFATGSSRLPVARPEADVPHSPPSHFRGVEISVDGL